MGVEKHGIAFRAVIDIWLRGLYEKVCGNGFQRVWNHLRGQANGVHEKVGGNGFHRVWDHLRDQANPRFHFWNQVIKHWDFLRLGSLKESVHFLATRNFRFGGSHDTALIYFEKNCISCDKKYISLEQKFIETHVICKEICFF